MRLEGACNGRNGAVRTGAKTAGLCGRVFAVFCKNSLKILMGAFALLFPKCLCDNLIFSHSCTQGTFCCVKDAGV